jgi:hypothetical protein
MCQRPNEQLNSVGKTGGTSGAANEVKPGTAVTSTGVPKSIMASLAEEVSTDDYAMYKK